MIWIILDDAISAPSVPGREPGADSIATNKDGIEVGQFIYYRQLSADIKIKNHKIKTIK